MCHFLFMQLLMSLSTDTATRFPEQLENGKAWLNQVMLRYKRTTKYESKPFVAKNKGWLSLMMPTADLDKVCDITHCLLFK